MSERTRSGHELTAWYNDVDQTKLEGFCGAHMAAGKQKVHRNKKREAPWQAQYSTGICHDSQSHFGQEKLGMFGSQDEIACKCEFEARAYRHTVNRRDYGFVQVKEFCQSCESARPQS